MELKVKLHASHPGVSHLLKHLIRRLGVILPLLVLLQAPLEVKDHAVDVLLALRQIPQPENMSDNPWDLAYPW